MKAKDKLIVLEEQVSNGLSEAYRKMAEFKKIKNSPLIVSKNGSVVEIPAEEIPPTTKAKE